MTTDPRAEILAKIDAEITKITDFFDEADNIYTAQSVIEEEDTHLMFIKALRVAVERHHFVTADCCGGCGREYPCPFIIEQYGIVVGHGE